MAGSVNKVILVGNLGRDPEVRHTQDGKPIVNLSIATSETWRDRNTGERKEKTEWHRVVIFNEGLAKVAEQYLKKGSTVYIEGQLQTRKYTDKDGVEKYLDGGRAAGLQQHPHHDRRPRRCGRRGGGALAAADEFGQSSPMERPRMGGSKAQIPARDLDDEVPF